MNAWDQSVKSAASGERQAGPPPAAPEDLAERPARAGRPVRRAKPASARSVEGRLLARLLVYLGNPPIEFVLWTGERIAPVGVTIVARVRVSSRATLLGILADVQMRFPDAYSEGRLEIEGDLVQLLETVYHSGRNSPQPSALQRFVESLRRPHINSLSGSRENIHHHYDISNEFYSLWLGETMAYTCAYYPTPTATLDAAQTAKMHHVCRKVRLRPGETVVEAGCGWGMLAMHMARHYGVKVRAFNISREQVAYARERAAREGLSSQVEYVLDDYRNIAGRYDAFVSVGMLEHVGVDNYPALGQVIARSIDSRNGRGLIHSIGRNRPAPLQPWIEKRIFPGAYPPSLAEMMRIFEPYDFSVLDVENLRLHYAQTLRHWLALFEAASGRVRDMFDEKFVRMWRMYLAGSVAGFTTGALQLFQVVFAPRDNNDVPMTREHLYTP